jgi:peptidoglycan/LPS O-acetylase OafA/YrhL
MTILRRALQTFAAIYAGCGLLLIIMPRWLLTTAFDQPVYPDYTYVQIAGTMSIGLALFAVMVSRRDDAWWWAWGFAVVTALCATITILHASLAAPPGGATLWWLFALVSVVMTGWLVLGLTRASQEHPIA